MRYADFTADISGIAIPGQNDVIMIGDSALPGVRMHFERNEEIFGQGEPADCLYRVVAGAVRTVRFSSDGRRQVLGFHLPGDIFGLQRGKLHALAAEALTGSEIVVVRRTTLDKAAAACGETARALLDLTARQLADAQEQILMLGYKGAGERVGAFLATLAARVAPRREFDLPMSRADIADYLGLTIESVSRAFTEMERQQIIDLPRSRRVVLRSTPCRALAA